MQRLPSLLFGCWLLAISLAQNNGTHNSIGFPEVDEDTNSKNKDNRQPVYLPAQCPANELYYPGDQQDDWICDCRPSFLYHPGSDSCWAAFQRGPCAYGDYLVLPSDSVIPVCEKNPCNVDNYVFWNNRCERLGTISSCAHLYPIVAALGVNATTLKIDCVRLNLETRFGSDEELAARVPCQPGSKLSVNKKCHLPRK